MQSTVTSLLAPPSAPDVRLRAEYGAHKRRLVRLARRRYGLAYEDCEEIANQALFAWYEQLLTSEGVRDDHAFCSMVVRRRAVERLRRRTIPTVELSAAEDTPEDVPLDELVAERDEIRHLRKVACEVLDAREYAILRLSAQGTRRAEIAELFELSPRQVKRILERVRRKLDSAHATPQRPARCGPFALIVTDFRAGRIGPGDSRWNAGVEHLAVRARGRPRSAISGRPSGR